jgi:hypothetical protein
MARMRFAALIVCVLVAAAAPAKTFRWSSQGD